MVGRKIDHDYYRQNHAPEYGEEVVLEASNINLPRENLRNISFQLHKGEILGFCGLSDAGTHTIGKILSGMEKAQQGVITIFSSAKAASTIASPKDAIRAGVGYVPKDRDKEGLMLGTTIRENICMPALKELAGPLAFESPKKLKAYAQKAVDSFEIKTTGITQIVDNLSGGNKQKVNLSRWLQKELKILILDCPTRGVDISVKAYIYHTILQLKKEGLPIILISDELPECIGLSDRLVVMKNGEIVDIIERGDRFTEEAIIEVMI